jgi:hypothetical protein
MAAPGAIPGGSSVSGGSQASRELALGQTMSGTLAGQGDADEYAVQVQAGTPVNVVLEVPHSGSTTQLRASIHQPHHVTGALAFAQAVIVGSDDGEPGATEPVTPERDGRIIVRVEGVDSRFGGRYVLRVLPTGERAIRLGEAVQGTLAGRGDTDDYTLAVDRAVRFNARVAAPHRGATRLVQVQVYHRNPTTGELHFLTGAIADSSEGSPAATDPVTAAGPGTYVVRVHGMGAAGTYELVTEQL